MIDNAAMGLCQPDALWLAPVCLMSVLTAIFLFVLVLSFEKSAAQWKSSVKKRNLLEYRQTDGALVWKDDGEIVPMGKMSNEND